MKITNGWGANGNGTNESGFNAYPGGYHNGYGDFMTLGYTGFWWSSSEKSSTQAVLQKLVFSVDDSFLIDWLKKEGYSVRCIRK